MDCAEPKTPPHLWVAEGSLYGFYPAAFCSAVKKSSSV
jgi:hypothetical protein